MGRFSAASLKRLRLWLLLLPPARAVHNFKKTLRVGDSQPWMTDGMNQLSGWNLQNVILILARFILLSTLPQIPIPRGRVRR